MSVCVCDASLRLWGVYEAASSLNFVAGLHSRELRPCWYWEGVRFKSLWLASWHNGQVFGRMDVIKVPEQLLYYCMGLGYSRLLSS